MYKNISLRIKNEKKIIESNKDENYYFEYSESNN